MTSTRIRVLACGSAVVTVASCAASVVFLVLGWEVPTHPTQFGPKGFGLAFALVMGGVGTWLAWKRPENPIGWIFCLAGVLSAILSLGIDYARWALMAEDGRPPLGLYAAWFSEWLWVPLIGALGLVAAVFPDGRFLSPRWRIAIWISIGLCAIPVVLLALVPRLTSYAGYDNPVGIEGIAEVAEASSALIVPLLGIGAAAALVRFRRSRGEERQQLKWLAFSISIVAILTALYGVTSALAASAASVDALDEDWIESLMILGFLGVPVSIAFGVLKYRLYDIDVVIGKAVVYGALAVFITIVYVAIVVGIGAAIGARGSPVLSAIAAAVVALAFQPVRVWAQRLANRVVYGDRATPYQVLAELGDRLAGEYATDDVVQRVAATLAGGLGAERVVVWLAVDRELRPVGVWPPGKPAHVRPLVADLPPTLDDMTAVPIRHQGETLGAIGVRKPETDPITESDERLVADLAGQAGLVLRNVRLIEELRASRQRLVAAQDEERRRIERNIHDGAQQQLVALSVKVRLADTVLAKDPERARALLAELQTDTTDALETLRDLARGIYPPLLADKGLVAALEAQARKSPVPVHVSHDGVGRFPREVETAVYFCTLEALQNIGKYAQAEHVEVGLEATDGVLRFEVRDDGVGFDVAQAKGSGLTNMRDRLDALGGSLEIRSKPTGGTTVSGIVPVASR